MWALLFQKTRKEKKGKRNKLLWVVDIAHIHPIYLEIGSFQFAPVVLNDESDKKKWRAIGPCEHLSKWTILK